MYNENIDLEEEPSSGSGFDFKNFYYNNKKIIYILLGIVVFMIFISIITSCDKGTKKEEEKKQDLEPVLVLGSKTETVTIGNSKQITATVTNYPNAYIMYSSSDDSIATVSNSGLITGKNMGTATIYVVYVHSSNKVYRDECQVTVSLGNESVKLSSAKLPDGELVMGIGSSFDLGDKLDITPSNAYIYQKHFDSNNSGVAKVSQDGIVKAVSAGNTYITVSVNNDFESKIKVIVLNKSMNAEIMKGPETIAISSELIKLKVSETKKIEYSLAPTNADTSNFTWTSSDTSVALVNDKGEVKGLKEGSSTITVTAPNGVYSKTIVEVSKFGDDIVVDNVTYSESSINIMVGQDYSLVPTVTPANAVNKALTFISDNPSIASVTSTSGGIYAIIRGVSPGTTTITFTSSNGKYAKLTVNVMSNSNNNNNNGNSNGNSDSSSKSHNNGGSSSVANDDDDNNSSSTTESQTNDVRYALIKVSDTRLTMYSSSYTTFKISANIDGTFELSTDRKELFFPSSQSKSIKVKANQEVQVKVQASKSGSSSIEGTVYVDFYPSDSTIKKTTKLVHITVK